MFKGQNIKGEDFYNLLFESQEFTSELGKVTLASGKLEAELKIFLSKKDITGFSERATLGTLITIGEQHNVFDNNLLMSLRLITKQRNYITHNIYALFTEIIDETILEKSNLLDSDVHSYIERAWQLQENIENLTNILKVENGK